MVVVAVRAFHSHSRCNEMAHSDQSGEYLANHPIGANLADDRNAYKVACYPSLS